MKESCLERARLQPCRKCNQINTGFSPCGMVFLHSCLLFGAFPQTVHKPLRIRFPQHLWPPPLCLSHGRLQPRTTPPRAATCNLPSVICHLYLQIITLPRRTIKKTEPNPPPREIAPCAKSSPSCPSTSSTNQAPPSPTASSSRPSIQKKPAASSLPPESPRPRSLTPKSNPVQRPENPQIINCVFSRLHNM